VFSRLWAYANLTDPKARSAVQREALSGSDALIAEAMNADVWVIGAPLYNFGVPASLKAWIDQIARAGDTGVVSPIDFATPWLKFVLGFFGLTDLEIIAADRTMMCSDAARLSAENRIDEMLARDWPALAAA